MHSRTISKVLCLQYFFPKLCSYFCLNLWLQFCTLNLPPGRYSFHYIHVTCIYVHFSLIGLLASIEWYTVNGIDLWVQNIKRIHIFIVWIRLLLKWYAWWLDFCLKPNPLPWVRCSGDSAPGLLVECPQWSAGSNPRWCGIPGHMTRGPDRSYRPCCWYSCWDSNSGSSYLSEELHSV